MADKQKKNKKNGPSMESNVNEKQQEWHNVTSDDEEAYVNEMNSLYKD